MHFVSISVTGSGVYAGWVGGQVNKDLALSWADQGSTDYTSWKETHPQVNLEQWW